MSQQAASATPLIFWKRRAWSFAMPPVPMMPSLIMAGSVRPRPGTVNGGVARDRGRMDAMAFQITPYATALASPPPSRSS